MELVVVGYGNMAKAMLGGLLKAKRESLDIDRICISGRNPYKIQGWLNNFFANNDCSFSANEIVLHSSVKIDCDNKMVLLACKPYNLSEFSFSGYANIVYSVLAGINVEILKTHISANHHVLIMPNVGAMHALSSSSVLWNPSKKQDKSKPLSIKDVGTRLSSIGGTLAGEDFEEIRQRIFSFVSSFGNCVFVETQKELNASIATNGSAPAILALVAQALINAGVHQGLKLDSSRELTCKSFEGIAELLKHKSPQEIKDSITSPGGTTAEALLHCDKNGVQGIITEALTRAVKKANGEL